MPHLDFKTPEIPSEIREISHVGYKNIYEYGLNNRNLWGTETLLGDWDGEYLLIAKDFYPSSYIENAIAVNVARPYCHNESVAANRNLIEILRQYKMIDKNTLSENSNFLYVSACFLLRTDGKKSGYLPSQQTILKKSSPALQFTIQNMKNLKTVVAMGDVAKRAMPDGGIQELISSRRLTLHTVWHPTAWKGGISRRMAEWSRVFNNSEQ